jgi:hypothetical protein
LINETLVHDLTRGEFLSPQTGPQPLEMAFFNLKARPRAMAARTIDDLRRVIGNIGALFRPDDCYTTTRRKSR